MKLIIVCRRILAVILLALPVDFVSCAESGVESGFVDVDGGRLYYEAAGNGETVVLIHGFTLDRRMWDNEFSQLAERFRCIRYDLRGHGKSSPVSRRFSQVDDLAKLLETLKVDRTHLIGLSLGGCIATDFSIAYPDRARDAVLIDPYYPLPTKYAFDKRVGSYVSEARKGKLKDGLSGWLADPLFKPANDDKRLSTKLKEIVLTGHGSLGDGALFVNADKQTTSVANAGKSIADVRCRVLCLVGKRDLPRFHAVAQHFSREIQRAEVVEVPDAGHMANMESPEFVMTQIDRFLTSNQ